MNPKDGLYKLKGTWMMLFLQKKGKGLPGGIPSEAFVEEDALFAIERARKVINFVEDRIK